MTSSLQEMVSGYLDGLISNWDKLPEHLKIKSAAYRHGWLNGLDDRLGRPREPARVLRSRADMIINNTVPHKEGR